LFQNFNLLKLITILKQKLRLKVCDCKITITELLLEKLGLLSENQKKAKDKSKVKQEKLDYVMQKD